MLLIDIAKLLIFPTVMAFAASSDFFTMTISNRISLILTAGFFALALGTGMPLVEIGNHVAAGALVLALAFFFFIRRWVGGGILCPSFGKRPSIRCHGSRASAREGSGQWLKRLRQGTTCAL